MKPRFTRGFCFSGLSADGLDNRQEPVELCSTGRAGATVPTRFFSLLSFDDHGYISFGLQLVPRPSGVKSKRLHSGQSRSTAR